ncbi:NAD(P)/FAD-dependent oxidoreductase [Malonomonas rubra]|uniref:NAD(P)/FAD-dependent oxidoreductase n=1 Tax=Malonomonas rubra TaxID=57040 RepID=UPI0026ECCC1B|nr:NAD(P)/FAD-dependent oxidoreductase [Malonomonas rubra]
MILRLREVPLRLGEKEEELPNKISEILNISPQSIRSWQILRKGIDARRKPNVLRVYTVDFTLNDPAAVLANNSENKNLCEVAKTVPKKSIRLQKPIKVLVVGMGPAGLFAALQLAESGAEVVLVERGKPVPERLLDVQRFQQLRQFEPESNIQFGEGGAGTFSDGKLTSRLNHPLTRMVLETLVRFGAPEEILWQAKPHVGSDRLRAVLVNFRQYLQRIGVVIRFSTKLTGIRREQHRTNAAEFNGGELLETEHIILALGHSARDTYQMLADEQVMMEQKPFAVGLRVEHPLELINSIQYGMKRHPQLPAAEYSLTWNNKQTGRGVYSFCMCPGGVVVNAASETGGIVVNGMSNFQRNAEMSNSALVVSVCTDDFGAADPMAGVRFQRNWEQCAFTIAGGDWSAPAQPLCEFLYGEGGQLHSSCQPSVQAADLNACLPEFVSSELRSALPYFDRQMKGFICEDATLIGVETRTSAPLRILRTAGFESQSHPGLYPAGEGAGYAGGIMSAAVDGLKVANAILEKQVV